jgi:ATP synthase protein I
MRGIAMNPEKKPSGAWSYMGVGSQMVAATFLGAGIGWWLDKWTGKSPLFLVIFFMLGSAAGFISVYRAFHNGGGPQS